MQAGRGEYEELNTGSSYRAKDDADDEDRVPIALKVSDLETNPNQAPESFSDCLDRTPFLSRPSSDDEPLNLPDKLPRGVASASPTQLSRGNHGHVLKQYRNCASVPAAGVKSPQPGSPVQGFFSTLERKARGHGMERTRKKIQFEMDDSKPLSQQMDDSRRRSGLASTLSSIKGDDMDTQKIKYEIEKAIEEKSTAENLCRRLKDRLATVEGMLTEESDSKRSLEMENKKQKTEIQSKASKIEDLKDALQELESKLEKESNYRNVLEEKNREKDLECQHFSKELEDASKDHADAVAKLEMSDNLLRETQSVVESLRNENLRTSNDLTRLQEICDDQKHSSDDQIKELRGKLDKKCEELTAVEKRLFQLQAQHENEVFKKNSIEEKMEKKTKEDHKIITKLESEIRLLQDQLKNSNIEHREKMDVAKVGLSDAETEIRHLAQKLKSTQAERTEARESAKTSKTALDESQTMVWKLKNELREEKMLNNTLESEMEVDKERMKLFNEDCEKLTEELEMLKNEILNRDQNAEEKQRVTNAYIDKLKDDFASEKDQLLSGKRHSESVVKNLQNDLHEKETELTSKCKELTQCSQQLENTSRELKTEKGVTSALDEELKKMQRENSDLSEEIKMQDSKLQVLRKEKEESDVQTSYYKSELESSKDLCQEMTLRGQKKDKETEALRAENSKIKASHDELKKSKLEIEADLREERARFNGMRDDLVDANKNRDSLQKLLSNVKADYSALEDQLSSEKLNKSYCEKEVEEQKALLDLEMKSRSKIGLKVIEMEKQMETLRNLAEEEKRKCQVATDQNEMLEQRSLQHQQEVSTLKNKMKMYQRKLKEAEIEESRLPALRAEFDVERQTMSAGMTSLRRQLDQLSEQLSNERNMRSTEEKKNRRNIEEITELKTNEKVQTYELEQSKRTSIELEEELQRVKDYYEASYCPIEELEDFKKSLEKKVRLDLQQKLQEANMALEEESLTRTLLSNRDRTSKSDYLTTFNQLKSDINNVKSTLSEQITKSDVEKYKDLFQKERKASQKLEEKLLNTNEQLQYEKQRTSNLLNDGKAKVTKQLFEESFNKIMNENPSPRLSAGKSWSTPIIGSRKMVAISEPLSSIKRLNSLQ